MSEPPTPADRCNANHQDRRGLGWEHWLLRTTGRRWGKTRTQNRAFDRRRAAGKLGLSARLWDVPQALSLFIGRPAHFTWHFHAGAVDGIAVIDNLFHVMHFARQVSGPGERELEQRAGHASG